MLLYSIVGQEKNGSEGNLGFEKRESSFKDLVEIVNLRYRNYQKSHSQAPLFSKYNEVKNL